MRASPLLAVLLALALCPLPPVAAAQEATQYGRRDFVWTTDGTTYTRRVDPETGAPVRVVGSGTCQVRRDAEGTPIGPDGVPGTGDESVPSVGNCLLWAPPSSPGVPQAIAENDPVAAGRYANQTLFHTLCTLLWREDGVRCAILPPNDAGPFALVNALLSGRLGSGGSVGDVSQLLVALLGSTPPGAFQNLNADQKALLGCGPTFLSACDDDDAIRLQYPVGEALGISQGAHVYGGIDLMNADASVLVQEWGPVQAFSPGAPVGSRGGLRRGGTNFEPSTGLYYEPGITTQAFATRDTDGDGAPDNADFLHVSELVTGTPVRVDVSRLSLNAAGQLVVDGERVVTIDPAEFDEATPLLATDFEVEPLRWQLDTGNPWVQQGVVLFKDPLGDDGIPGTGDDPIVPGGESCSKVSLGPDPGCTVLEMLSANLQRLSITNEIFGGDDFLDPPETLAELDAMLDLDPGNNGFGDPISGADGIVFANWIVEPDVDADGDELGYYGYRSDEPGSAIDLDLERYQRAINKGVSVSLAVLPAGGDFEESCGGLDATRAYCFRELVPAVDGMHILGALPVGMLVTELVPVAPGTGAVSLDADGRAVNDPGAGDFTLERLVLPLQTLHALEIAQISDFNSPRDEESDETVVVTYRDQTSGELVTARIMEVRPVNADGTFGESPFGQSNSLLDINTADEGGNNLPDLDEDKDGQLDFLDDGTLGPISDDSPLCGSGIPGDILQQALMHELAPAEIELLEARGGLPPRSPFFCSGVGGFGNSMVGFDLLPPEPECEELRARGRVGIYRLGAEDNLDAPPEIYLTDAAGSGPFGPLEPGTIARLMTSPGRKAVFKVRRRTRGPTVATARLNGPGVLVAVDAVGNARAMSCGPRYEPTRRRSGVREIPEPKMRRAVKRR